MEKAKVEPPAPGGSALSIYRDEQREAGDAWLEGDCKEDKGGPFSPFPTLGITPFGTSWLPHALVDGKPGIPGAGEKMIFAGISCEPDVLPMLGSAEMQHVWEAFPTTEALAGSRWPQLGAFCVQGAELEL